MYVCVFVYVCVCVVCMFVCMCVCVETCDLSIILKISFKPLLICQSVCVCVCAVCVCGGGGGLLCVSSGMCIKQKHDTRLENKPFEMRCIVSYLYHVEHAWS